MIVLEIIVKFLQSYSRYIYQIDKKDTDLIAVDWYKRAQKVGGYKLSVYF
jgi:hypothetical protein